MNSKQFLTAIRRLGRKRDVTVTLDKKRGKGSHIMVYFGSHSTTLPRHRDKIPTGTLKSICRKLGINPADLN